jgi:NAD(P)H-flavin reductase
MGKYLSENQNAELALRGPAGDCFYLKDRPEEPLLLAGTGTGLAPLIGIVRSALDSGHRAPIHLFHGSKERDGLYLSSELVELSQKHELLSYAESVLQLSKPMDNYGQGPDNKDLLSQVKEKFPSLRGYRVYLCGNPEFVYKMRKQCFLAGAAMQAIHSDPFVLAPK